VALDFARAELGGLEAADDVLEGGGAKEVLLLESQVLAFSHLSHESQVQCQPGLDEL
jgi:hypothetical protein